MGADGVRVTHMEGLTTAQFLFKGLGANGADVWAWAHELPGYQAAAFSRLLRQKAAALTGQNAVDLTADGVYKTPAAYDAAWRGASHSRDEWRIALTDAAWERLFPPAQAAGP